MCIRFSKNKYYTKIHFEIQCDIFVIFQFYIVVMVYLRYFQVIKSTQDKMEFKQKNIFCKASQIKSTHSGAHKTSVCTFIFLT